MHCLHEQAQLTKKRPFVLISKAFFIITYCCLNLLNSLVHPPTLLYGQVLDDVEPPRRPPRDHEDSQEGDARTAYLQPSLKAEPLARPELERDHPANIDFERYRGRV